MVKKHYKRGSIIYKILIFIIIISLGGNILLSPNSEIVCEKLDGMYILGDVKTKFKKKRITKIDIIEEIKKRHTKLKLLRKLISALILILLILIVVNLRIIKEYESPITSYIQ